MIEEAYVSQDIAMRLREKGFTEKAGFLPTQQMAMRWLREEKGIFIQIIMAHDDNYDFRIWKNREYVVIDEEFSMEYETYELAVAFGLLFVLTKMEL